jgi:hypothetical protein
MTFTLNKITLSINNQLLIICAFYFVMAYFFALLFKRSNLFFKIPVFIFIMTVFALVQKANMIEITLSSLLGVVVVYKEAILDFIFTIKNLFDFIIDSIKAIFRFIFDSIKWIFYLFALCFMFPFRLLSRVFGFMSSFRGLDRSARRPSENSQQQSSREEELKRAREEVKQARERAKQKEQRKEEPPTAKTDSRSHQEILGLAERFTQDELKQAYRIATLRYHPDKYSHMSKSFQDEAQQEFVKIQQAYKVLSDRFK